jgi:predicted PhzF superfamily epimerase YddE/YHI9
MRIPYYEVDAFTSRVFGGNPAGVCVLEGWLPDGTLQKIAAENNLSETAFLVREEDFFHLRWFTPAVEVDLCGHATLASAAVIFSELGETTPELRFKTRNGWLRTSRRRDRLELDFPSRPPTACPTPDLLVKGLGAKPRELLKSRDYLAVFDSAAEVAGLSPDFNLLSQLDCLGVIVTAPGQEVDFVSRFFAPQVGIPEDPATGSSHCTLIPYWSERLGKAEMVAKQLSRRGGELFCRLLGERVGIGGQAVIYLRGEIQVDEV